VTRYFHLVKNEDVNHTTPWDYKIIEGLRSMHFIASISHRNCTLLNVHNLVCLCTECMDDNSDLYGMKSHVKSWRLITLEPNNVSHV
jgi:hypothetical protein